LKNALKTQFSGTLEKKFVNY